jgi:hypothetical protein
LAFFDELAREEIKLRRALFVTIAGTRPKVHGSDVVEEVACSFEVNVRYVNSSSEAWRFSPIFVWWTYGNTRVEWWKSFCWPSFQLAFQELIAFLACFLIGHVSIGGRHVQRSSGAGMVPLYGGGHSCGLVLHWGGSIGYSSQKGFLFLCC